VVLLYFILGMVVLLVAFEKSPKVGATLVGIIVLGMLISAQRRGVI